VQVDAKVSEKPALSIKIPLILKMDSKLLRNIDTYLQGNKVSQLDDHSLMNSSPFISVCNTSVIYFASNYDMEK
jgi:hypothetical protein